MTTNTKPDDDITRFWDLESLGIKPEEMEEPKKKDSLSSFQEYIEKGDKGYVAKLPWKPNHDPLPTNYAAATRRTRNMILRLPDDTRKVYQRIIQDQESRGFIEKVENDDIMKGHYLPHRALKKDSITTPIRIVYDCSASSGSGEPSLNDCLDKGPALLNDLVGILIRFRIHPIAFTSDIEKAFLNISLHENDRDFTKFLWLEDADDPNSDFVVYRFSSVLFGSVSSPALLNVVVQTHLSDNPSIVSEDLKDNMYVDNVVSGAQTTADATSYYQESNELLESAGFKLRSWTSNDSELRKMATLDGVAHEDESISLLGLKWNTHTDTISYKQYESHDNSTQSIVTKREVLSRVSSIYDPLGYLAPVHIRAKTFIKVLWKENLEWDESLPEKLLVAWNEIDTELQNATKISIPRQYVTQQMDNIELHCFADSSLDKGYGAAIYLKTDNNTSIVMAKTRVTPNKELTLPRLELMAATLGARLTKFVSNQIHLKITKHVLWSDSQIVLSWLNSKKHLPIFVKNRVEEIRTAPFVQYKYCPTQDNPSDLLTRGISVDALEHSTLWWQGPSWLATGDWPTCRLDTALVIETTQIDDAQKAMDKPPVGNDPQIRINRSMDIDRFGTLSKLLRVTALALRFVAKLRKQKHENGTISPSELKDSEITWIKSIQNELYGNEKKVLEKQSERVGPLVKQLRLFLDPQGLIRCGGRIHNAPVDSETKFPILLPSKHKFTVLVVRDRHAQTNHSGLEATMASLRQQYWITKARQTLKSILRNCVICRKVNGKSYRLPIPPPLQSWRLAAGQHCFTYCGLDYTGCLYVKLKQGMPEFKVYVALFTCAVSRAIHLELVTDLTPRAFLNAFRRFAARRSLPRKLISDNQSTFLVANEELNKLFNDPEVNTYLAGKHVDWSFIPKRAPNFGGFYERLIGITKLAIKKVLGRACVTLDELQTTLCEIEAVLNDRPITHVSSDVDDLEALTPSHLLHGRRITPVPHLDGPMNDPDYFPAPETTSELNKRARYLATLHNRFWRRWSSEYIPALRERHQANKNSNIDNLIKTGDVVIVHSDTEKRANWKLAQVEKLHYGNDGLVRSADIRLSKGRTSRPIIKLFPLEINSDTSDDITKPANDNDSATPVAVTKDSRPTRQAALRARQRLKSWAKRE